MADLLDLEENFRMELDLEVIDDLVESLGLSGENKDELKKFFSISKIKKRVLIQEIKDLFEDLHVEASAVNLCVSFFKEHGIKVLEEEVEEESSVKVTDDGRIEDPVRLYLKEMGSIPLLSREDEVKIAKDIIKGKTGMLNSLVNMPFIIKKILDLLSFVELKEEEIDPIEALILEEEEEEIKIDSTEIEVSDQDVCYKKIYQSCLEIYKNNGDMKENKKELIDLLYSADTGLINKLVKFMDEFIVKLNDFDFKLMEYAVNLGYSKVEFFKILRAKHAQGGCFFEETGDWGGFLKKITPEYKKYCKEFVVSFEKQIGFAFYDFKKEYVTFLEFSENVVNSRKLMVESNLKLVISLAKRYTNKGLHFLDLIQEGNIGLMKAVEKFDAERGNKFSTYATHWIKQSITRAIADQARTIRIPVHMIETFNKIAKITRKIVNLEGREPTEKELSEHLDMPLDKVKKVLRIAKDPVSMNAPMSHEDEDSSLAEVLEDKNMISTFDSALHSSMKECITKALSNLSAREDRLIRMRFGIGTKREHTLEQVGNKFKVTRERIRQLEAKLLRRMSMPGRSRKLRDFLNK